MRSIVIVLLVSVAAIVCASTVFSATIHVPADQPTIQAGINAASNESIDSLLLAYWSFNDSTSSDNSGNGHDGNTVGASPVPGRIGTAFQFEGNDDYVEITNSDDLDGMPRMTFAFWFQYSSYGGSSCGSECMPVIAKWYSSEFVGRCSFVFVETGGGLRLAFENNVGALAEYSFVHGLNQGDWNHIAVVFDSGLVAAYINGYLKDSARIAIDFIGNSTQPLRLGSICDGLGYRLFHGALDEVRIYGRALNSEEVKCLSLGPSVQSLTIPGEQPEHVTSEAPVFSWALDPLYCGQVGFQVQVGSDSDWGLAEMWDPPPNLSTDTFVSYAGVTLTAGATYYCRLRVSNGYAWSQWQQASFRMNSVPAVPLLKAPINLAPVTTSMPTLWVLNATDAENDALTYDFAGFHDTDCVAGPAINLTGVTSGVDSTGGVITDPLAENCRYWWRARSFDGFEYSEWSPYGQFMVNGSPEAPTAPILDSPPLPDNKPVFTLLPTLSWLPSFDPDPSDTVRYKLELSLTANFSFVLPVDSLLTTQWTVTDSLMFGTRYWWRVTARDRNGLTAMSGVKDFWTWKLGDVNHSHGIDLSDLSLLIAYLTQTPRPDISPKRVGDLTGNCRIDLSDLSLMISYLTQGGVGISIGCE